eukprot:jgi/Astpho2/5125/Aster-06336
MILCCSALTEPSSLILYFVDGMFPKTAHGARTLLITSPDRIVYKEVIKRRGFDHLYMPVWTLEELETCMSAMYPGMQVADVRSRFDRWGGIPRFVLEKLSVPNQSLLEQAIASATLPSIIDSVGRAFAHPEISHRILHLHVEADLVTTAVRWASLWVAEAVAMRLFEYEKNNLIAFLSAVAVDKDLAGLRGILWEGYCHRRPKTLLKVWGLLP